MPRVNSTPDLSKEPTPAHRSTDPPIDVLIIGAGPAGASTAYLLAKHGVRTMLTDRSSFPRHKVCGGCLAENGRNALESIGLGGLQSLKNSTQINQFTLHHNQRSLSIEVPTYRVIERSVFDQELVEAAIKSGAKFCDHTEAKVQPFGTVIIHTHQAPPRQIYPSVIIIADGLKGSSLRDHPSFKWKLSPRAKVGMGSILSTMPTGCSQNEITMFQAKHGYVGVAPLNDGRALLAGAVDPAWIKHNASAPPLLALGRSLGIAIDHADIAIKTRGTPTLTRQRNQIEADGHIFLIGDAKGYLEPFTGEGMSWAIEDAMHIAQYSIQALAGTYAIGAWTRASRRRRRRQQLLCQATSMLMRSESIMRRAVRLGSKYPGVSAGLARLISTLQGQHIPKAGIQ